MVWPAPSAVIKLDTGLEGLSPSSMASSARRAEELGFAGLMTAEASHEPYLPLMLAAEHTERIDLLTGIALAFTRSPMTTAYTAWDLQRYTKGRFILGLGTQIKAHNEKRFSVPWDRPGPRLRDLVLSLRAIWDCWQNGGRLRHEGEFYKFSLMTPFFNPGPQEHPGVPVYIAGVNPYMCRLAGELCDGFHVHPIHTVKYLTEVVRPLVAEGAARSGRDPAEVKYVSGCFVVFADSDEERERWTGVTKQQIAFYASTPAYKSILAVHGWEELGPRLTELSKAGKWEDMASLVSDEMLSVMAVIGRRDEIAAKLIGKYSGLLDRITLYCGRDACGDDWWSDLATRLAAGQA